MTGKQLSGLVLILASALFLIGCGPTVIGSGNVVTKELQVNDFNQIRIAGSADVVLVQGDEVSVVAKTDDNIMEYVSAEVSGNRLTVGLESRNMNVSYTELTFFVTAVDIEGLKVSGSGDLTANELNSASLDLAVHGSGDITIDNLLTDELDVKIAGSGDISVGTLQADQLAVDINGSGDVAIDGNVRDQIIDVNGSGQFSGNKLQSETAEIDINGSGEVTVWASDELDVNISGSGDVLYYGNPQLSTSSNGSGDVIAKG